MATRTRDRIIVESQKVGLPAREGEILEIIEASYGTRYRVAWDDGTKARSDQVGVPGLFRQRDP